MTVTTKPLFLFHASEVRGLSLLRPMRRKTRDRSEGAVVFGTPDKAFASLFMVLTDDSWTKKGQINGVSHIVIADRARFEKADQGGVIYTVSGQSFVTDPHKGMGELEWVSREPVHVSSAEEFSSGLRAMIAHGVKVYFTDVTTLKAVQGDPDSTPLLLAHLKPEE